MRHGLYMLAVLVLATAFSGAPPTYAPANVFLTDPSQGSTATVQLERLDGDGTRLTGRYVTVTSDRLAAEGEPIEGIDGAADYRYEPNMDPLADCTWHVEDCSPFDAVNVYYHIDRYAQEYWVDRLGVEISFRATAVTHYPGEGAYANLPPGTIKFGLGTTMMKNAALDPDIIHHEYTHLVTTSLGFDVDLESSTEMRAVNEGVAHYFAASFSDDPRIGEWVVTCPPRRHCAGPENDTEMATLATDPAVWNWNRGDPSEHLKYGACTRFYPLDGKCKIGYHNFTQAYTWGMIWGSALWDLREAIGAATTDRLVLESLKIAAGSDVRFSDAIAALLDADRRDSAGRHSHTIAGVFSARGFNPSGSVDIENPNAPPGAATLRLKGANPIAAEARLSFTLRAAADARIAIYDALGRRVALLYDGPASPGTHDIVWSSQAFPSGRYFAVLTSSSERESILLTVVR